MNVEKPRILVRFNTKFEDDKLKRKWRVLLNGIEHLAHNVAINVPCETITEPIDTGEIKHHFLCYGNFEINNKFDVKIFP